HRPCCAGWTESCRANIARADQGGTPMAFCRRIPLLTIVLAAVAHATDVNLLPNGSFAVTDQTHHWQYAVSPTPGPIYWSSDDADLDPDSGSMEFDFQGAAKSDCFRVVPGAAYSYGGQSEAVLASATGIVLLGCVKYADSAFN